MVKKVAPHMMARQSGSHFRFRRVFSIYSTMDSRLSSIKQALVECALHMEAFLKSKNIKKTNLREVALSGQAPELDYMMERDERMKKMAWFPSIIKLIGKIT